MTTAVKDADEQVWRWERVLTGSDTLDDDLGMIGTWVRPRKGPFARGQDEKEDYTLRRLLVAWKQRDALSFPVTVCAERQREGRPDFVLSWKNGDDLGVEVTEAGEEDYQKSLTNIAEVPFEVSTPRTVEELRRAIQGKVAKFDNDSYRLPGGCDLLIYDNTATGGYLDKSEILREFGRPNDLLGRFRQVHIVFGEIVWLDIFGEQARVDVSHAYEIDYARWIWDQIERLREGAADKLDLWHIAEELADLGRSQRRELGSHLRNLLAHLLKHEFQPQLRSRSWQLTIDNARDELYELLTESPSLRSRLISEVAKQYGKARRVAANETGLPIGEFPEACPYRLEQLLDPEFYSEETSKS